MTDSSAEQLVGRLDDLTLLHELAARAASGDPQVVIVQGPAGAGKTALLRAFQGELDSHQIMIAAADELATHVSMAMIDQIAGVRSTDPFAAGMELVEHLASRQSDGPVALLVEDLQWADERSRQTLLAALRRLGPGDAVLVVVTSRDDGTLRRDGWERFADDPQRCRRVDLGPLSMIDVGVLATMAGVTLGPSARRKLHEQTGGHALYVKTLLRELDAEQLRSPAPLPAPRSLAATTVQVLDELPASGAALLKLLAVIGGSSTLKQLAGTETVADPLEALEHALASGLIEWRTAGAEQTVRFVHPLYRSAIYDAIGPVRRRDLHLAAAQVAASGDAFAARVAAATGPDGDLTMELVAAANASADAAAAGQLLVAAADLSTTIEARGTWLVEAGHRYLKAGLISSLRRIEPQLTTLAPSIRGELLLAALELESGDVDAAERRFRGAIADGGDTSARAELFVRLAELYVLHGRGGPAVEAARAALEIGDLPLDLQQWADALVAVGTAQVGGGPAGLDQLASRFPQGWEDADKFPATAIWARAVLEAYAGHEPAAAHWYERAIARAPESGLIRYLAHMHTGCAHAHHANGSWDAALQHARSAFELASDHDQLWVLPVAQAMAAQAHAARGEFDRAENCITDAQRLINMVPTSEAVNVTMIAAGYVAQARGRPAEVAAAISGLTAAGDEAMLPLFNLQFVVPLVRALIDVGRLDEAAAELDQLRRGVRRRRLDLDAQLEALDASMAAATGDAATAIELYERAYARFDADTPLLERVLTLRATGRTMLQLGRRVQAVGCLRAARHLAATSGALPYLQRLDGDLHEAGLRSSGAQRSPFDLTDRERDVAFQVGRGLTNKEIAALLYVSSKAVEYHLGNIYAKLGINSRRQLRDLVRTD